MSEPLRLAIVGTENSHAEEIIRALNVRRISPVARVVALVGPEDERNRALAALGGIEQIVPTSRPLIGQVAALIVTHRDGGRHPDHAVPFLEAGTPVWVDKPLATTVAGAETIISAARRGAALMTSYSAVRWLPDADRLQRRTAGIGDIQTLTVTGPADPSSPYGGLFFYGIHTADLAQRLAPGEPGPVQVERAGATVVARYRSGGVLVTLQFVKPADDGRVPFHAHVTGRVGMVGGEVRLGADYMEPGLNVFLQMLHTRRPPLDDATLLAPIRVLEQIAAAL